MYSPICKIYCWVVLESGVRVRRVKICLDHETFNATYHDLIFIQCNKLLAEQGGQISDMAKEMAMMKRLLEEAGIKPPAEDIT